LENVKNKEDFLNICPTLLFNYEIEHILNKNDNQEDEKNYSPWLLGMIFTGVVTLWSWNGAVFLPIIEKKFYKRVLTFMISLAFGCLTCNSLLNYLPLVSYLFLNSRPLT
jgi:hypothetical protein